MRIMVWSRCGRRLFLHPSISCSTSRSVRYSRVLTSPFLGRRGVTFRISALGGTTRRAVFVIDCRAFAAMTFRILAQERKFAIGGAGIFWTKGLGSATTSKFAYGRGYVRARTEKRPRRRPGREQHGELR